MSTTSSPAAALSPAAAPATRSHLKSWLLYDSPYIAMLLLALAGVTLRLPVLYWIVLMPVFGIISMVAGWPHATTRQARIEMVVMVGLCWAAVLLSVWMLFSGGVKGVLNANGTSLAMLTLLALGTFVAGVEAKVWRICAIGLVLFVAVPGLGWLDQSPLLWTVATLIIVAISGVVWWIMERPANVA